MSTPFDALVRSAETDPEAAAGLALAYADLSVEARCALLEVLEGSAPSPGRAQVLALLLGVEDAPELAERIASAMDPGEPVDDEAFTWGDADAGGVALVRGLHGAFVEGIAVRWEGAEVSFRAVPLARAEATTQTRRKLGVPADAEDLHPSAAIDRLTERLWWVRRATGSLPDRLRPLADLLP